MSNPFIYEGSLEIHEDDGYFIYFIMCDTDQLGRLVATHFNPGDTSYYPAVNLPRVRLTIEVVDVLKRAEEDAFNRKDDV